MNNDDLSNSVPVVDLAALWPVWVATEAFLTRNMIWLAIGAVLLYILWDHRTRHQKTSTVATMPEGESRRRTWRDVLKALKTKLWLKPRAIIVSKKRFKQKERMMAELVALQQVLAVEQCWVKGWITREYRDKCVDDIAFRFSIPDWFTEGRLKIVKAKIKKRRMDAGLPMTLDEAGFPKSIVPQDRPPVTETKEEEDKKKFKLVKAA